jgi:hypothetical protein
MSDEKAIHWEVVRALDYLNNICELQELIAMSIQQLDECGLSPKVREARLNLLLEFYKSEAVSELEHLRSHLETAQYKLSHCRQKI